MRWLVFSSLSCAVALSHFLHAEAAWPASSPLGETRGNENTEASEEL